MFAVPASLKSASNHRNIRPGDLFNSSYQIAHIYYRIFLAIAICYSWQQEFDSIFTHEVGGGWKGALQQSWLFGKNAHVGIFTKCEFGGIFQDDVPGMTVSGYLPKKEILPFLVNRIIREKEGSKTGPILDSYTFILREYLSHFVIS
jgi:hypothetical protein